MLWRVSQGNELSIKAMSDLLTVLNNAPCAAMQGFVALMAIYTAFAFTCTAWGWFIGPTANARQPSRMLVSHCACCHTMLPPVLLAPLIQDSACCHVMLLLCP